MSRAPLLGRPAYRWWQAIGTRWLDNDMYGHVNNTAYYAWFDTVVNNWLIETGLLSLDVRPLIGLVVQSGCRYASSLSYPDLVEIGLLVDHVGNSSVTYRLGAFRKGSEVAAAEGSFTHVYVNAETHRPLPLPDNWRTALTALAGE